MTSNATDSPSVAGLAPAIPFPRTYGEVMLPLVVDRLPEPLLTLYRSNPRVTQWVHLQDRVRRAEKVSSWTQWTADESAAYDREDYRRFSQLRGYADAEIDEFEQFIHLTYALDAEMHQQGEVDFCINAEWEIQQIVRTPAYERIEEELARMSEAGRSSGNAIS